MCPVHKKLCRLLVVYWYLTRTRALAWNLNVYHEDTMNSVINNENYTIVHVSVFYVRAFLTIKYHGSLIDR